MHGTDHMRTEPTRSEYQSGTGLGARGLDIHVRVQLEISGSEASLFEAPWADVDTAINSNIRKIGSSYLLGLIN